MWHLAPLKNICHSVDQATSLSMLPWSSALCTSFSTTLPTFCHQEDWAGLFYSSTAIIGAEHVLRDVEIRGMAAMRSQDCGNKEACPVSWFLWEPWLAGPFALFLSCESSLVTMSSLDFIQNLLVRGFSGQLSLEQLISYLRHQLLSQLISWQELLFHYFLLQ